MTTLNASVAQSSALVGTTAQCQALAKSLHPKLRPGVTASELIDNEEAHFDLQGILGLQLRSGKPMTVQFKDIHLKQAE